MEPSKLTAAKLRRAEDASRTSGQTRVMTEAGHATTRLPPGQTLVQSRPVLDLGKQPEISCEGWSLRLCGNVQKDLTLSFDDLEALPATAMVRDIHCVTKWSRYDNRFAGYSVSEIIRLSAPGPEVKYVLLHGTDGYTTCLSIEDFTHPDAMLAVSWDDIPLDREHGGPVRFILPHLYFWKSVKWIKAIEFLNEEYPGFWELGGYHHRGDPWKEERYASPGKTWGQVDRSVKDVERSESYSRHRPPLTEPTDPPAPRPRSRWLKFLKL